MKYSIFLFLFLLFFACCKNETPLPPNIWTKEKMVAFLTEAQLIEAKINVKKTDKKRQDSLAECYYNELFIRFDTDKETMLNNMIFYKDKPELLEEIYTDVISNLSLLESQLTADPEYQETKNR